MPIKLMPVYRRLPMQKRWSLMAHVGSTIRYDRRECGMTSPQDNRIFHFPPWGPGEPIESYRHRKRLAFDTWSAQRSAMLARTDSAGRPLYRVTSGGNIVRTKPITKRLKKRILTRDGNRCVECGSTKWLEIAHVEPYRISGNNADDNLRTLCNPCHQAEGLER